MNQPKRVVDFEELGFRTVLETREQQSAERICALQLHSYNEGLSTEIAKHETSIIRTKNQREALRTHLYDRPVPVLVRVASILVIAAAIALVAWIVLRIIGVKWGDQRNQREE